MSAVDALQLAVGSGVLAGGLGLLKWGLTVEGRLLKLEIKARIEK